MQRDWNGSEPLGPVPVGLLANYDLSRERAERST
jgi:hypothetical protein